MTAPTARPAAPPTGPGPSTAGRNARFARLLGDLDGAVRALYAFHRDHGDGHARAASRVRDAVAGSLRAAVDRLRAEGGSK